MTNNWKQVNMEIGQLWVFKGAFLASLTSWLWTAIFPSSKIKYTPESCLLFCTLAGLRAVQDNMSTMLQWDDTAYSSEVHWDQTQNSLCLSQGWPAPADLEHCTPKQLFFFFNLHHLYQKLLALWPQITWHLGGKSTGRRGEGCGMVGGVVTWVSDYYRQRAKELNWSHLQ